MTPPPAANQAQALISQAKRAMELHRQGDMAAAEQQYAAVVPFVQHPGLYVGYAALLASADRPAAATWRRRTLALYPDHGGAVELPGAAALAAGDNGAAARWLRRRLRLDGGDMAAAHGGLGVALTRLGVPDAAVRHCAAAADLNPGDADHHFNLAVALEAAGRMADSMDSYRRSLALRPDRPDALENFALAAMLTGDAALAGRLYRRLAALLPERPDLRFLRGEMRLAAGDWVGGWADFEARRQAPALAPPRPRPEPPPWRGEALPQGELLLAGEQGVGDAILFARFIPLAMRRANRVVLAIHDSLARLMSAQWPEAQNAGLRIRPLVASLQPGKETAAWAPLGSLAALLAAEPEQAPVPPYLRADADLTTAWARRLNDGRASGDARRTFGLVWAGNPRYKHDRWRSPGLAALRPLLNVPGWRPAALQVGPGRQDLTAAPWPKDGVDLGAAVQDFADTAAIIANLDLVISSDTSVLHLAAAMGKETWGVTARRADWRWRCDDCGAPAWYPKIRLFRQREIGRWDDVAADLRAALELEAN